MTRKVLKLLGCLPSAQDLSGDADVAGGRQPTSSLYQRSSRVDASSSGAHDDLIQEKSALPSAIDEDIRRALFVAVNESMITKDELESPLDIQNHLKMITRSKSQAQDVEGTENFGSEEKQCSPEPSRNVREMVRRKFQIMMLNLGFAPKDINSLERELEGMWMFCALLPQHCEFERDTLVQLWMAVDFVIDSSCKKPAVECFFDALVAEGCIQDAGICYPTGKSMYRIDTGKLNSTTILEMPLYLRISKVDSLDRAHPELEHLCVEWDDFSNINFDQIKNFKYLKTFKFHTKLGGNEVQQMYTKATTNVVKVPYDFFLGLIHLQVLDLSGIPIVELPNSIGHVKKLKYIDLSFSFIEQLPETIDCLNQLQTLKLRGCIRLFRLPEGIVKLSNLQHLDLNILGQLSVLPKGMGALTKLETLSAYIVDTEKGRGISELSKMNNLTEELCISQLDRVSSAQEAKEAALSNKNHLNKVELRWSNPRPKGIRSVEKHDYEVLQQLRPPSSLEHLKVSCYGGLKFPDWLSDHVLLHTLVSMTLIRCEKAKYLPPLGALPSLRVLQLIDLTRVKKITGEFRGKVVIAFPALEKLVIQGMSSLETWTEEGPGDFPRLCKLTIERCPKLISIPLSCFASVKHVQLSHCTKFASLSLDPKLLPDSLKKPSIDNCPSIKKKYSKIDGKDFLELVHVPNVWIDQKQIMVDKQAKAS